MDLVLSRHAEEKVRLRALSIKLIKDVLNNPDQLYFDIATGLFVSMKSMEFRGENVPIVVVYRMEKDSYYVVTAYPCKEFSKEAERKIKKGRWVKVERRGL